MRSTKKNNQWHFGLKAHTGVDMQSGLVHSVHTTAANEADEADVAHGHTVLHGQESLVGGDAGFIGLDKREEVIRKQQSGQLNKGIKWMIATKRSQVEKIASQTGTRIGQAKPEDRRADQGPG